MYSIALPAPTQPPHMMMPSSSSSSSQNGPQQQQQQQPTTPVRPQHQQHQHQQQQSSPMSLGPAAQAMYLQAQQYASRQQPQQHQHQHQQLSLQTQQQQQQDLQLSSPARQQQQQQQSSAAAAAAAAQHHAHQAAIAYANTTAAAAAAAARRRASSPAVVFPPQYNHAPTSASSVASSSSASATTMNGGAVAAAGPSSSMIGARGGGAPLMRPQGAGAAMPPGVVGHAQFAPEHVRQAEMAYMQQQQQQQMAAMAAAGYTLQRAPPVAFMQQQQHHTSRHPAAAASASASYSMQPSQQPGAGSGPSWPGAVVAPPPGFSFEPADFDDGEMMTGMAYDPYQVKHRKRTTPEQLSVLERAFDENSKPSAVARKMIADQIGMTPRSVQVWFQNRRQKRKMAEKKRLEEEAEGGAAEGTAPNNAGASSESPQERSQSAGASHQQQQSSQQQQAPGPQHPSTAWTSIAPPVSPQRQTSFHRSQPPPHMVYTGIPVDLHQPPPHLGLPRQPAPLPVAYPVGAAATMSQARRGSLPYPTPGAPPPGALANAAAAAGMRVVSGPGATRTHVPLRLAMTMTNGGRRASLPGTGRIMPLSSAGAKIRELSPIQDEQSAAAASAAQRDVKTDPIAPTQLPGSSSGLDFVMPKALVTGVPDVEIGAMPNPGFTFGGGAGAAMGGGATFNAFDGYTFGGRPDAVISPGEPSSSSSNNPFTFRGRMGSIASIFTQTTDAGTDGGTLSDTDRFQQGGAPFDMSQYTFMPVEGGNGAAAGAGMGGLQVPVGFNPDERRASAPAELLQQLSGLEVDHLNPAPPAQKRRSPLNTSFIAEPSPADSNANTGRSSAMHSSSLASFDMRTGHAQDLSRSSQSSVKPESPADVDLATQFSFDPNQFVMDGSDPLALLDQFGENGEHFLDPASMQLWNAAVDGLEEAKPGVQQT